MNQLAAFRDTIAVADEHEMPELGKESGLGLAHLRSMYERAQAFQNDWETFSEAKLGRWLGWAQCAVVAANVGVTLDDMKQINRSHAAG